MIPDLKLDLSSFSSSALILFAAPVAPGLATILGVALLHPDLLKMYFALSYLGYFAKMAVLVLLGYIAGLTLWMTIVAAVGITAGFLAACSSTEADHANVVWQQLTRDYFDKVKISALLPISSQNTASEWKLWWEVLKRALDEKEEFFPFTWLALISTLQSTTIVAIIVLYYGPFHHWILWAWVIFAFLVTSFTHGYAWFLEMREEPYELSARILRRLANLNAGRAEAETGRMVSGDQ